MKKKKICDLRIVMDEIGNNTEALVQGSFEGTTTDLCLLIRHLFISLELEPEIGIAVCKAVKASLEDEEE